MKAGLAKKRKSNTYNIMKNRTHRGSDFRDFLKEQGILVRYFNLPGLTDKIRISIGSSQENNALIAGVMALSPVAAA